VSNFFTVVAADLVLLAVTFPAFVADVVAPIATFFCFLTVTSEMTDAVTFVALLTYNETIVIDQTRVLSHLGRR
jgi:hypothetical protein